MPSAKAGRLGEPSRSPGGALPRPDAASWRAASTGPNRIATSSRTCSWGPSSSSPHGCGLQVASMSSPNRFGPRHPALCAHQERRMWFRRRSSSWTGSMNPGSAGSPPGDPWTAAPRPGTGPPGRQGLRRGLHGPDRPDPAGVGTPPACPRAPPWPLPGCAGWRSPSLHRRSTEGPTPRRARPGRTIIPPNPAAPWTGCDGGRSFCGGGHRPAPGWGCRATSSRRRRRCGKS